MKLSSVAALGAVASFVCIVASAHAQEGAQTLQAQTAAASNAVYLEDSVSPFGAAELGEAEMAAVKMPVLAYTPDGSEAGDFDKYFYFYRADTDFATAYADVRECDGYARGLSSGIGYTQAPYPYAGTMAGAVGGAIGNAMVAAIFGSGEKRRLRRANMRTCMHFKGYDRYGLPKKLWTAFNFEEGLSSVEDDDRTRFLKQQALVASSARPQDKALGL
ncbi:hypothetical protein AB2M62_10140 [Sphingomonas sp. MMS12-HWE2-04]|uniref:hypothetical protein n=1 Tax=Sphingomonas sp. MMS12-HWE2-04 TaxID=3234199 RepID=UPI00384FD5EB